MALPLGKLTILIGAGIVGSVLVNEGSTSDFLKGAFKIAWKQLKRDDSTSSSVIKKPRNDSLMDQVNSLRQELLMLSSNRPITIVTASGTGASKYGTIIIVVVVGYGYVWWKGWKLPDMMFATRRGLSDACTSVAHQLENVYASIRSTRRHLSADIDRVDSNLDEVAKLTADTHERVTELRDESQRMGHDVRYVRDAVETLEQKISRFEGKQDLTYQGVKKLVGCAKAMEDKMQGTASSSRITYSSKIASLPAPSASCEPPSASVSNGSLEVQLSQHNADSASGQQRSPGISAVVEVSSGFRIPNGIGALEERSNGPSSLFQAVPSVLMRRNSATKTGWGRQ